MILGPSLWSSVMALWLRGGKWIWTPTKTHSNIRTVDLRRANVRSTGALGRMIMNRDLRTITVTVAVSLTIGLLYLAGSAIVFLAEKHESGKYDTAWPMSTLSYEQAHRVVMKDVDIMESIESVTLLSDTNIEFRTVIWRPFQPSSKRGFVLRLEQKENQWIRCPEVGAWGTGDLNE